MPKNQNRELSPACRRILQLVREFQIEGRRPVSPRRIAVEAVMEHHPERYRDGTFACPHTRLRWGPDGPVLDPPRSGFFGSRHRSVPQDQGLACPELMAIYTYLETHGLRSLAPLPEHRIRLRVVPVELIRAEFMSVGLVREGNAWRWPTTHDPHGIEPSLPSAEAEDAALSELEALGLVETSELQWLPCCEYRRSDGKTVEVRPWGAGSRWVAVFVRDRYEPNLAPLFAFRPGWTSVGYRLTAAGMKGLGELVPAPDWSPEQEQRVRRSVEELGRHAKPAQIIRSAHVAPRVGRRILRHLLDSGEYSGFAR